MRQSSAIVPLCIEMDPHHAKRNAFRKHCNDLRLAIDGNRIDLSYELYTAGLITEDVRDRRNAEEIVAALESRLKLRYDESAWDNLIEVLHRSTECEKLAKALTDELTPIPGERNEYLSYVVVVLHALFGRIKAVHAWRTYLYTHSLKYIPRITGA